MTDRDRLIELIQKEVPRPKSDYLAIHLLANGVIVPPCKVGDMVYEIQSIRKRIQEYKVIMAKYNGNYWWFEWRVTGKNGIYENIMGFNEHNIGKTVFLTKEEAEEKIKGV